ncbi:hypothetical protein H4R33_001845 [Dimargaris cristalligena]|uniref:Inhibitor I9 domain-containing protein n=1 Tax=Dimargaris cristalligena TaxID=215637 RepID=A0A4V1J4H9_9FUNG|nr:hypothetical protein H4R33_001845 [Dimargaris cristalligena]RKP35619.1 hypothetical protein BJ085DRAFT_36487 [Dimargaris cristalligena]|eukprot:RKP35619.1 hypothetical protein BJ085DRAFT_36487 [Dimargaris cristalligena]
MRVSSLVAIVAIGFKAVAALTTPTSTSATTSPCTTLTASFTVPQSTPSSPGIHHFHPVDFSKVKLKDAAHRNRECERLGYANCWTKPSRTRPPPIVATTSYDLPNGDLTTTTTSSASESVVYSGPVESIPETTTTTKTHGTSHSTSAHSSSLTTTTKSSAYIPQPTDLSDPKSYIVFFKGATDEASAQATQDAFLAALRANKVPFEFQYSLRPQLNAGVMIIDSAYIMLIQNYPQVQKISENQILGAS